MNKHMYPKRNLLKKEWFSRHINYPQKVLVSFIAAVICTIVVSPSLLAASLENVDEQCETLQSLFSDDVEIGILTEEIESMTMDAISETSVQIDLDVELQSMRELTPAQEFVRRLYLTGLNREPDIGGLEFWANNLSNRSTTGSRAAEFFLLSQEFQNKSLSNEAYVNVLYSALMDRVADSHGRAHWKNRLETGVSRYGVLRQFLLSSEFTNLCERYGIERGDANIRENRDINLNITSFVFQQYKTILDRDADVEGVNFWIGHILNEKASVESVADHFLSSEEFIGKNTTNEEYVKILYRAFMGRESDESGLGHWVSYINKGGTIEGKPARCWVFEEFAYSEEFRKIIESYGLTASKRPSQSEALKGKVVIIDPGHGGSESGAVKNGVIEKKINLEIAWLVKSALEAKGATVYMTRTSDRYVSLYHRNAIAHLVSIKYARERGISTLTAAEEARYIKGMEDVIRINNDSAASGGMGIMTGTGVGDELRKLFELEHKLADQILFISIHANSNTSSTPHGTQVYYATDDAVARSEENNKDFDKLSEAIFPRRPRYDGRPNQKNRNLSTALYQNIVGQVPALTTNSGTVIAGNYAYLREHGLVGAMVETGFLSNKEDSELLQKKEVQAGITRGIVAGIQEYFA